MNKPVGIGRKLDDATTFEAGPVVNSVRPHTCTSDVAGSALEDTVRESYFGRSIASPALFVSHLKTISFTQPLLII